MFGKFKFIFTIILIIFAHETAFVSKSERLRIKLAEGECLLFGIEIIIGIFSVVVLVDNVVKVALH